MWFSVDHASEKRCSGAIALELYLNDRLVNTFHGDGAKSITVNFVPASKKSLVHRLVYGRFIDVQVRLPPKPGTTLVEQFRERLAGMQEAVAHAQGVALKSGTIDWGQLSADVKEALGSAPTSEGDLAALVADERAQFSRLRARDQALQRAQRRAHPRPLVKRLKGVRVYERLGNELTEYLAPFGAVYGARLKSEGVMTPGYEEIYVYFGRDEDFVNGERALEQWHEIAPGKLDFDAFAAALVDAKCALLSQSIEDALLALAAVDHLDITAFQRAFDGVRSSRLDVDLVAAEVENGTHRAEILYNVHHTDKSGRVLHRVRVTDRTSGRFGEAKLDYLDLWSAPYSMGKLVLTKRTLKVKARTGERAKASLRHDGLPDRYSFDLGETIRQGKMEPASSGWPGGTPPIANARP